LSAVAVGRSVVTGAPLFAGWEFFVEARFAEFILVIR